jgi:NAD(P)-dependent dehydrogenase (short-subunit alcohol dehydrogenase family)
MDLGLGGKVALVTGSHRGTGAGIAEVLGREGARAAKKGWGEDWATIEQKVSEELFVNPTGRLAKIEEVGSLVAFVASEQAGYLNAANLRIDGGAADCAV